MIMRKRIKQMNNIQKFSLPLIFILSFSMSYAGSVRQDEKPKLKDNFYQSINYDWLQNTVIPNDKVMISNFSLVQDEVNLQLKNLFFQLQKNKKLIDEEKKVRDLYLAFMDMKKRNHLGITPIQKDLDSIDACKTHDDIMKVFANFSSIGLPTPIVFDIGPDSKDSTKNVVFVSQYGIALPKSQYGGTDKYAVEQRKLYTEYLISLMKLAKIDNPEQKTSDVMNVHKKLAAIQWSPEENRDPIKTYNKYSYNKLKNTLTNYSFDSYMKIRGLPSNAEYVVFQPTYFKKYNALFTTIKVSMWKNYLRASLLSNYANFMGENFVLTQLNYQKKLGLLKSEPPRWRLGVEYVGSAAPMLLGKVYSKKYLNDKKKRVISNLVENIIKEFKIAITESKRLSPETKRKGLKKLAAMTYNISHPDKWDDFSSLVVRADDLIGNNKRSIEFYFKKSINKLGKPIDKNEWYQPPQMVNAYYSPNQNKFVLLGAILRAPFFDLKISDAALYGGIGFVIAHEIGHGFDDQGSLFDADGNLNDWWTEKDRKSYEKLKQRLIKQANAFEIQPGVFLKGEIEVGEIIGDLNGGEIALKAYQRLINKQGLDEKIAKKEFFMHLGKIWRTNIRAKYVKQLIETDSHPPAEYRINGTLKNMDAFHDTFKISPKDKMYMKPKDRVQMW